MSTATAKDLTKEVPRSPYDELDQVPWLPRMIDKVRALQAGTLGEYIAFPCGGDKNFLTTFNLNADEFKLRVFSGASDSEVSAWVKQKMPPDWEAKAAQYRAEALEAYPPGSDYDGFLQGSIAELKAAQPGIDTSKITNFGQLICVEEGHPF